MKRGASPPRKSPTLSAAYRKPHFTARNSPLTHSSPSSPNCPRKVVPRASRSRSRSESSLEQQCGTDHNHHGDPQQPAVNFPDACRRQGKCERRKKKEWSGDHTVESSVTHRIRDAGQSERGEKRSQLVVFQVQQVDGQQGGRIKNDECASPETKRLPR